MITAGDLGGEGNDNRSAKFKAGRPAGGLA
jgi:hypothetical protein